MLSYINRVTERITLNLGIVLICLGIFTCNGFAQPVDISGQIKFTVANESSTLDRITRNTTSTADVTLTNSSSAIIAAPLHAVISIVNPNGVVSMPEALGGPTVSPYNKYYYDLSSKLTGGQLAPGAKVTFKIKFVRPALVSFTYVVTPYGTVSAVNQPPVANAGINQTITLQPGQTAATVTLSGSGSDSDGTIASYTWSGNPPPSAVAAPSVTLGVGTYTFSLVVTDNQGAASAPSSVTVTVNPAPNRMPAITTTSLPSALAGQQYLFTVSATDPDNDTLVYTLVSGPSGMTINSASGGLSWSPTVATSGSSQVSISVSDGRGGSDSKQFTLNVSNIIPPAPPVLNVQKTPTNVVLTVISGTAEKNLTVKVFSSGTLIGSVTADGQGAFSLPNVTLSEGPNSFTAQAVNTAGIESLASTPLAIVLDTKPPMITVTAPPAGTVTSSDKKTITGTVDEELSSLTVNSTPVVPNGFGFEYEIELAEGENSALITATDLVGNSAGTSVSIVHDSTPPKVLITAPLNGLLTNTPQIQVSGTVDDAEAALTVGGGAVTVSNKTFTVSYLLSDGDNNIQARAMDKAGNEGTATVLVTLDAQPPVVTLNAPATATAGTDVQISVNATDNRGLTLVDLSADGASLWSASPNAATAGQNVSLRLSPALNSGATVTVRATAMDAAGNSGSANAVITIDKAADGPGWLQGKVLDDSRGLPLAGALVQVTDSKGVQQSVTTPADGAWFFETASGPARIEVNKGGFTTVRRDVTVRPGQRTSVLDSRLTRVDGTVRLVDAAGGIVKSIPFIIHNSSTTIDVTIPAGALPTQADLRLTPLSNQGLITPLPAGWSPLAVLDLRLLDPVTGMAIDPQPLTAAATLALPLPHGMGDGALTAYLARYDNVRRSWLAAAEVAIAAKATAANVQISQPGQYALLLADPAPASPAKPVTGQELAAVTLQPTDFSLINSTGRVVPQAALPAVGLRAAGDLWLAATADASTAPPLTSGLIVNARVTEKFDLISGDTLQPNATVQNIILYRTPCATSIAGGATEGSVSGVELRTTFPVSPSRDFTIVDLLLGKISIDITPPDTSGGVMVGTDGARILQPDGTALNIPAGALNGTFPVTVATLPEASIATLVGSDFRLLRGVELGTSGQLLKSSATISIPAPAGFDPALPVVVARKFDVKGGSKLKLVAMGKLSGSIINSEPLTPELINSTNSSNSINSSGVYCFLQATAPIGYLSGQVTDSANAPFAGIQLSAQDATLADLTAPDGRYLLALAAGEQRVTALDPARGDAASANALISTNTKTTLNLTVRMVPPSITTVSPANGATNVQPTVPVVVTFSKPMDKNSINTTTLKLTDLIGTTIPGVITWNAEATIASFYPADAFKQETGYRVTIASTVKDLQGYPLGQNVVSGFTVRRTTPPVMPPAGAVSGTFPDADGYISVTGTQGSAEAGNTVLLINDTTGEIQSVTPQSNGSFSGKVRGQLGDEIKVVLMDSSGNQTTISYLTFKGPDGSYLVTAKGGKIEGNGGSLLEIPEGALSGKTIIKMSIITEANLPHPAQEGASFVAGVNIDTGGVAFQKPVQFSVPLPAGYQLDKTPFVASPDTLLNADGTEEKVFVIVDSAKVENGRLSTACEPFGGVMTPGFLAFFQFPVIGPAIISGYTYQDMNDMQGYQPTLDGSIETPIIDAAGNTTYKYDRPIKGAVIRTPAAWNYISYSNSRGFYAGYATVWGNIGAADLTYSVTAIHPLTMRKTTLTVYPNYERNIQHLNFKLADKATIQPDKTAPSIELSLQVVPGQPIANRILSGVMPLGTELTIPLAVIDQSTITATMTVTSNTQTSAVPLAPQSRALVSAQTSDKPAIWKSNFKPTFSADLKGSQSDIFKPKAEGVYQITVEATDASLNKSKESITVRVMDPGAIPGGIDGPPTIDFVSPGPGSKELLVDTQVAVWFSEPVNNVTSSTFKLIDTTTSLQVPAIISSMFVNGRTRADLVPQGNLAFGRTYKVILTAAIVDATPNASSGNAFLPLAQAYQGTFTTMSPNAYDLSTNDQFKGGREIALYNDIINSKSYTYVAANDKGWRVMDVSKPTTPKLVHTTSSSCVPGASPDCTHISSVFSFRGVAVHPDANKPVLAMTENISYPSGSQYGYIRFYDLAANAINPPKVGQERLAEEFSGIPGRVAMWGDYAYVATAGAALQVVSISAAIDHYGQMSDGSSIVGVFDSIGQNFGSPNDIYIYGPGKALLTTNPGYLLVLDVNNPVPVLMGSVEPAVLRSFRVAGTTDYVYSDSNGNPKIMDLAVAGGNGRIKTIDLSNPYSPTVIATVKDDAGNEVVSYPYDITINKATGLAIVTTMNTIQVIDIKDPNNPHLINTITQLPDTSGTPTPTGTPAMIPIGTIPSMVVNDGWLYMADETKGMRVLELGGKEARQCKSRACDR